MLNKQFQLSNKIVETFHHLYLVVGINLFCSVVLMGFLESPQPLKSGNIFRYKQKRKSSKTSLLAARVDEKNQEGHSCCEVISHLSKVSKGSTLNEKVEM